MSEKRHLNSVWVMKVTYVKKKSIVSPTKSIANFLGLHPIRFSSEPKKIVLLLLQSTLKNAPIGKMEEKRKALIEKVAGFRQPNLTVVLENVHDSHNIGAVMRTCDSVGIQTVYLLNTQNIPLKNIVLGKRTSSGSRKWLDVHLFQDRAACFTALRQKYDKIYSTHMAADAVSLYELDLTESVALVFGNERDGITKETLALCDGNFLIPQYGFVQSLNISVSCAISLYEALRQRENAGFYAENSPLTPLERQSIVDDFVEKHESQRRGKKPKLEG